MRITNSRLTWHAAAACVMPLALHSAAAQDQRVVGVIVVDARRKPETVVQAADSSQSLFNFARRQVTGGPAFKCADALKRRDDYVEARNPTRKEHNDSIRQAPASEKSPAELPGLGQLMAIIDCATGKESVPVRSAAADLVAMMARENIDESSLRIASLKGDSVRFVVVQTATEMADTLGYAVIVRGTLPRIKLSEEARKSQISTDIETFAKLAAPVMGFQGLTDPKPYLAPDPGSVEEKSITWLTQADQPLKLRRATLSLEISPGSGTKALWSEEGINPAEFMEQVDSARAVLKYIAQAAQLGFKDTTNSMKVDSTGTARKHSNQAENAHSTEKESGQSDSARLVENTTMLVDTTRSLRCDMKAPSTVGQLTCQLANSAAPVSVRVASAQALGESGSAAAAVPLRWIAASNAPESLRIAATEALGKLRVTTPTSPAAPQAAQSGQPAAGSAASGSTPQIMKAKLLTGPNEHWFLTADVPVTSAETFAFDEDTDQLDLVEEPSRFYVGLGFLFGDLASDNRTLLGNLVLKGMITLSKRPLDSYGFAVGFRGSHLKRFGLDFETLTPFVGYTFSLEDTVDSAGQVQEKGRRNKQFRFGVSLNLDRATSWMEQ